MAPLADLSNKVKNLAFVVPTSPTMDPPTAPSEVPGFDKLLPFAKVKVSEFYKEPEFTRKYDGMRCPKTHLKYYLGKMACYSYNPSLLINSFQDSLFGLVLTWFIELDLEKIHTWEDLANEFFQLYKFNTEIAPTREELVRVEKMRVETFRAYAQRWRATVSQVKPPLFEKEAMKLLLQAMPRDFFEKIYNHTCINFAALVELGECIEGIMHEGRLIENTNRRYVLKRDKESTVEIAYIQNSSSHKPYNPQAHKPAVEYVLLMDIQKLEQITPFANRWLKGDIACDEKIACLAKLAELGIIQYEDDESALRQMSLIEVDLSGEDIISKVIRKVGNPSQDDT
ncbi:uncharacterized protein LOC120288390 [Eucalyptus grandis]|uniref:uncharacterized protein LOC120288390 n=1 Tax=Eucalyptus grandis TaxID=71139 RepID=UPI00192ED457|nr:uncharacterized protein LOC120288390 [Eucalyptus grandis]